MSSKTCSGCYFWRTKLYSWGRRPKDGHNLALCTARDSIYHKVLVSRRCKGCPVWYDRSIPLTFLQNEGMEQGFSPGTSSLEVLVAEHPEEEAGVMASFEYANARAATSRYRANYARRRRR